MNRSLPFFLLLCFILSCSQQAESEQNQNNKLSNEELIAILNQVWTSEQSPIRLRDSIGKVEGVESEAYQKQQEIYKKNHAINEKIITDILDNQGWPDKKIIGEQGSLTICNVIQHSDNEIRLKYLPMMRAAVKNDKLQPRLLARTEDRIATERGDLQIYGGQIKYYPETKTFDVWPIIDPVNVDKRRAEIGLEPMAEFLKSKRFQLEWNLEDQIKRTEEFLKQKNQQENLNGS